MKLIGQGVARGFGYARQEIILNRLMYRYQYATNKNEEIERLALSKATAVSQMEKISARILKAYGKHPAEIIDAQKILLTDNSLWEDATSLIESKNLSAASAFFTVSTKIAKKLESHENDYLRQRSADCRDICSRVLSILEENKDISDIHFEHDVILVGMEILPSVVCCSSLHKIKGIAMENETDTSHAVLLSQMFGIPCATGIHALVENASKGEFAIVDGNAGEIILSPTDEEISMYFSSKG